MHSSVNRSQVDRQTGKAAVALSAGSTWQNGKESAQAKLSAAWTQTGSMPFPNVVRFLIPLSIKIISRRVCGNPTFGKNPKKKKAKHECSVWFHHHISPSRRSKSNSLKIHRKLLAHQLRRDSVVAMIVPNPLKEHEESFVLWNKIKVSSTLFEGIRMFYRRKH